jgi:hypothetical protein
VDADVDNNVDTAVFEAGAFSPVAQAVALIAAAVHTAAIK